MDSQLRSNGSSPKPPADTVGRPSGRPRVAVRVERVVNGALAGETTAVLNATAAELLAAPGPVVDIIGGALRAPGAGVMTHWTLHELIRRSEVHEDLINSLTAANPLTRAAAARLCGAARLTDASIWIADMLSDPNPMVRDAAVRALGEMGGRRAVEALMANAERIPLYRLAITLSQAASDVDIEALMRAPADERAAVATVLACGMRGDLLRVSPLMGIAHDRRWPAAVRVAACKALATIGDRGAADGLKRLAHADPDPKVKDAADRAHRRLVKQAIDA
jgi:hypothetical protein